MEGQEEVPLSQSVQEGDSRSGVHPYSMPGVVQFIQHEWSLFERERARWDVERAELQARVAYLTGERKGQENLKHDLMRRIKMLEFALCQERQRYHKLKYGCDPPYMTQEKPDDADEAPASQKVNAAAGAAVELRPGRRLLLQYLHEIGCTDNLLEIRRAHQFLFPAASDSHAPTSPFSSASMTRASSSSPPPGLEYKRPHSPLSSLDCGEFPNPRMQDANGKDECNRPGQGNGPSDPVDSEIDNAFTFLGDDEDDIDDEDDDDDDDESTTAGVQETLDDEDEGNTTEEAMAEFEFLNSLGDDTPESTNGIELHVAVRSHGVPTPSLESTGSPRDSEEASPDMSKKWHKRPGRRQLVNMLASVQNDADIGPANPGQEAPPGSHSSNTGESLELLGLGELAGLSVPTDTEPPVEGSNILESRKMWNLKYSLRSHFDSVRSLAFHPTQPCCLTASEDRTLKLWNLEKSTQPKKSALPEVEPVYTYRGHKDAVLSCQCTPDGQYCISGSADGCIYRWSLQGLSSGDLYDPFDSTSENRLELCGHTDAVWGLAVHRGNIALLASTSSDGTCRIWNWMSGNMVKSLSPPQDNVGVPTCASFIPNEPGQVVVGYTASQPILYDYEVGKSICLFQSDAGSPSSSRINCIACHPTLDMTIAGTDDRRIQFFDNRSGQVTHSMVAHLEAVTSLSIDNSGLYLLTGSHDCSLRLWNMEGRTCVQEMTSHRKKYDESVLGVAFHPTLGYLGSCGADSIAKVFV